MDGGVLETEQDEIHNDILRMQLHSVPLNLGYESQEEEEEEEEEEVVLNLTAIEDPSEPSTSGINDFAGSNVQVSNETPEDVESNQAEEVIDLSKDLEPTARNMLKLNLAYQEVLQMQIQLVNELLEENKKKQNEAQAAADNGFEDDANGTDGLFSGITKSSMFPHIVQYRMRHVAPHPDVIRRMQEVGEIFQHNPLPPITWKKEEEKQLKKGIEHERLRKLTEPMMAQLEYMQDKYEMNGDPDIKKRMEEVKKKIKAVKLKSFEELVGGRYEDHDWEAIANVHLEGTRTAFECALRWQNKLHVSLSQKTWSKKEEADLKKLVRKYKESEWKKIAEELGTGRTALQCISKYQQKNNDHRSRPWTPEEDANLQSLVNKFRAGPIMPFTFVAWALGRTSQQVHHRWSRSVNPEYKKTKWTPEEDILLLKAIVKYGQKWSVIRDSGMVPGRNDGQCRERWNNSLANINRNPFTEKEDKMIMKLVEKHGMQWAAIAHSLNRRTDNQVYHRWKLIKRMQGSGMPIQYRKKGPKTIADGLSEVRQKLIQMIERQAERREAGIEEDDTSSFTSIQKQTVDRQARPDSDTGVPLPYNQIIRTGSTIPNKKWDWISKEVEQKIRQAKNPDEILELYRELSSVVADRKQIKQKKPEELKTDKLISQKVEAAVASRYQPFTIAANQDGTNINEIRKKIAEEAKTLTAKSLFISFVKGMNINPNTTLNAIKAIQSENQTQDGTAAEPSKSCAFVRNLSLPLFAPNVTTTCAYRRLLHDQKRRVKSAKQILIEDDKQKQGKKWKSDTNVEEDPGPSQSDILYRGAKYKPEVLMRNIEQMPEHKLLRSRFVSVFTWPTLLASLVPYERHGSFRTLRAAVRVRKDANDEEEEYTGLPAAKKCRISAQPSDR